MQDPWRQKVSELAAWVATEESSDAVERFVRFLIGFPARSGTNATQADSETCRFVDTSFDQAVSGPSRLLFGLHSTNPDAWTIDGIALYKWLDRRRKGQDRQLLSFSKSFKRQWMAGRTASGHVVSRWESSDIPFGARSASGTDTIVCEDGLLVTVSSGNRGTYHSVWEDSFQLAPSRVSGALVRRAIRDLPMPPFKEFRKLSNE